MTSRDWISRVRRARDALMGPLPAAPTPGGDAEMAKALTKVESAKQQLTAELEVLNAIEKRRAQGPGRDGQLTGLLIDPRHNGLQLFAAINWQAKKDLRDKWNMFPVCRIIDAITHDQLRHFAKRLEPGSRWTRGYMLAHKWHDAKTKDVSKIEAGPEFQRRIERIDRILNAPTGDIRVGNTLAQLMDQIRVNYFLWDLCVIQPLRLQKDGDISGLMALDGGTLEPVIETIQAYVAKEARGRANSTQNYEQAVMAGKMALAQRFQTDPKDIDLAGYLQTDTYGQPWQLFRGKDLIVSIDRAGTDPATRGRGNSLVQQSIFMLEAWLNDSLNQIQRAKPGANQLNNLLWITGTQSPYSMALSLTEEINRQIRGYGTEIPILGIPTPYEMKNIHLDPSGNFLGHVTQMLNERLSDICALWGLDPREMHRASAGRVAEKGGMSSNSASQDIAISQNQRLSAWLKYIEGVMQLIVWEIDGTRDILFQFPLLYETKSEKDTIDADNARKHITCSEKRVKDGLSATAEDTPKPEDFTFDVGLDRPLNITNIPEDVKGILPTVLMYAVQAKQQKEAMLQQAMGASYEAAGMPQAAGSGPGAQPSGSPAGESPQGSPVTEPPPEMAPGAGQLAKAIRIVVGGEA